MPFHFAGLVVARHDEGDWKRQPFGLVHGHDLNRIPSATRHNGAGVAHSVPTAQEPAQASLLCASDVPRQFHQGLGVSVKPAGDAQHVAHVSNPRHERAVGAFKGTQVGIQGVHHVFRLEGSESTALPVDLCFFPLDKRVQHRRLMNAVRLQGRDALQPCGGVPFLIGVHHPSRQRDNRKSRWMTPHMEAVFRLGCDAFVEHVLGNAGALLVGPHQHRHVRPRKAASGRRSVVTQTTDDRLMEPLLAHLFVLVAHRFHPDFAFEIAFGVLRLLVVNGFQARRQAMLQGLKKPVVPIHNGPATSPIGPQHLIVQGLVKGALGVCKSPLLVVHDVRQMQQLSVVAVSPAVNRLFSIADHQGAVAFGEDVIDQGNEVLPLGDRRVLEFIHKHMPVAASQPLKQKRYWVVAHHPGDPVVQGMKRSDVSGFLNPFHLLGDEGQRAHQIHLVQKPLP